eukprot:scaffold8750_cov36-Cyclotella_meneghiniana.AAC.2
MSGSSIGEAPEDGFKLTDGLELEDEPELEDDMEFSSSLVSDEENSIRDIKTTRTTKMKKIMGDSMKRSVPFRSSIFPK